MLSQLWNSPLTAAPHFARTYWFENRARTMGKVQ
jgi:hypothetical protein